MSAKGLASGVHALRVCSPSVEDAHLVQCPWTAGHWYELFILHKVGCNFGRRKIFNLLSLLLSVIQAGFCSAISVSTPCITLKINTFCSISPVPDPCFPQNSKPLLDVRPVLLSLRCLCAKGLPCLKFTLSICMAAAFHPFVFSCTLLPSLSFHCDTSAVLHYGSSLWLSQPGVCQSYHPAFYYLYFH